MSLKIIKTSDGSHTIYDGSLNETYHSIHGSINESNHVYVNAGLKQFIYESRKKYVNILEVGFGTGLNFLLMNDFVKKRNIKIDYHTIEPNTLNDSVLKKLNFSKIVGSSVDEIFKIIHKSKSEEILEIEPKLDLRVGKPHPVIAALYHPPAGTARHDAVVWGYAREASKLGVEIFPFTEADKAHTYIQDRKNFGKVLLDFREN